MDSSPEENRTNFYVEPVEIEIYLKKSGTVKTIVKNLYIELIDEDPKFESGKIIFDHFRSVNEPIDLIKLQNKFPWTILPITESYHRYMDLYIKLSLHIHSGLSGSIDSLRQALYLTELLMKYEPTIASLEVIGDFSTFNLNYLIRKLNSVEQQFLLEDGTVSYLIKRKRLHYKDLPPDKEFDKLVELWEYNVNENPLV